MKTVLLIVVSLLVIGGGVLVYSSPKKSSLDNVKTMVEDGKTVRDSRYVEYSKLNLENAKNNRRVLFFYANWCPTCRPADANFSQNDDQIPSDVFLVRVNYKDTETEEAEKDLAAKYGVTYQHTFVQIDENGAEITKWNGGQITELLQNIK